MSIPSLVDQALAINRGAVAPCAIPSLADQIIQASAQAAVHRVAMLNRKQQGQRDFSTSKQGVIYKAMTSDVDYSITDICAMVPAYGRDAVRGALKGLVDKGLVSRTQTQTYSIYKKLPTEGKNDE